MPQRLRATSQWWRPSFQTPRSRYRRKTFPQLVHPCGLANGTHTPTWKGCERTRSTASKRVSSAGILCGYLGNEMIAAPIVAYDCVGANPAPADTGEVFDCSILAMPSPVSRRSQEC